MMKKIAFGLIFYACYGQGINGQEKMIGSSCKCSTHHTNEQITHNTTPQIENKKLVGSKYLQNRYDQLIQTPLTNSLTNPSQHRMQKHQSQQQCNFHQNQQSEFKSENKYENNMKQRPKGDKSYLERNRNQKRLKEIQRTDKMRSNLRRVNYHDYLPQIPVALQYSHDKAYDDNKDKGFIDKFFQSSYDMPFWNHPQDYLCNHPELKPSKKSQQNDQAYMKDQINFLDHFRNHLTAQMRNIHKASIQNNKSQQQQTNYNQEPRNRKKY